LALNDAMESCAVFYGDPVSTRRFSEALLMFGRAGTLMGNVLKQRPA
jgi:hypothetical protein